jgi:hypothetical protein
LATNELCLVRNPPLLPAQGRGCAPSGAPSGCCNRRACAAPAAALWSGAPWSKTPIRGTAPQSVAMARAPGRAALARLLLRVPMIGDRPRSSGGRRPPLSNEVEVHLEDQKDSSDVAAVEPTRESSR